jgi:peptidoglycan-associated lipoprotein
MKSNNLIYPLLVALVAASLATTGCKHKPVGITKLPGQGPGITDQTGGGNQGVPNTAPIDTGDKGLNGGPGNIPTSGLDLSKYDQDRAAFAANTVHFPFDSSAIKPAEEANVSAVASALAAAPGNALLIEGHCDERGTEEYNRALGERRADALREDLAKKGVSADRIKTISYGKDKPVDTGHTEAAFSKNRRGEFILLHPKAGM